MRTITIACVLAIGTSQAQQGWTLDQCLRKAEERNLLFRNDQLNTELARQAHSQSRWALLPDLNAGATHGYNWGKAIDRFTNTFATDRVRTNNLWLGSNWTLFQGMRLQNQRIKAGLDSDAAMKGLDASRNAIKKDVVNQFLNVLSLEEQIRAAEAQAEATRGQVDISKALVDAGRIARAEMLDLDAQLAQQELSVVDLQNQRDMALLDLGQTLNLSLDEQRTFSVQAPAIASLAVTEPTRGVGDILPAVLAADPAYARAGLNVKSAEKAESIARSGSIPSLSLNASVGSGFSGRNVEVVGEPIFGAPIPIGVTESGESVYTENVSYDTRTRPFGSQLDDNLNESLSFTLSVPLFNNMQNKFAMDQARIQREQAELQQEGEVQRAQREVQDALARQRAAYRQHQAATRALDAVEESLRYATERFSNGVITAAELNIAKSNQARATADVITARYAWVMAAKALDILQGLPVTL